MGARRELKWALERFWRGDDPGGAELGRTGAELRERHWRLQAGRGIGRVPSNDFSLYDHVLDTAVAVGAVPARFGGRPFDPARDEPGAIDAYFAMARGGPGTPPLELTKWFDTNYHYLVPELEADQRFSYASTKAVAELRQAGAAGIATRPVVLGPVTFLRLAKRADGGDPLELLDALLPAYEALVADLVAGGAAWIQLDEPALVLDLDEAALQAYPRAYERLRAAAPDAELTLATYFGSLGANAAVALALPVDVVHVDAVRGGAELDALVDGVPGHLGLSLGVVDGRNVWRSDPVALLGRVRSVVERLGPDRVHVAPSCSLLHLPLDVEAETAIDAELRSWMAFAVQRLDEVRLLAAALEGDPAAAGPVAAGERVAAARSRSERLRRPDVRARAAAVSDDLGRRRSPYRDRRDVQGRSLGLPLLPTTTIGSFPQTAEVRGLRRRLRAGEIDVAAYEAGLEAETEACVRRQEALGLDVLVHGELERTDMVEHFGEQLDGFATTAHGWVQSYGSRCVKPPVLYGDVARPRPMTVRWSTFAAGLTDRPVKGMLTGPVTILQWSFVRDDQPRAATARQVALALRKEVGDLEAAGIAVIQVDEPALREGLPLRGADRAGYLAWATEAFRLVAGGVADRTQVHTHMCYAEFGDILDAVVALDADVVSLEASRSAMELVERFRDHGHPNEIGPGVWDVHSPRVPGVDEIEGLIERAAEVVGAERLWVNPDCGLKTRGWPEVEASLANMVAAVRRARERRG
ncbi:MAG TPA: 5-methyltetrahydropteroyltriglutamate--homocysteine S-methyltransferase [Acidimicrobiales bacterium]|nr:5-methyltetrahydropteroyltriglutamate--homocysteine S-methyltransferase [Acidimicrobiales bacterium]